MTLIEPGSGQACRSSRECLWCAVQCLRRLPPDAPEEKEKSAKTLPPRIEMLQASNAFRAFLIAAQPALSARAPHLAPPDDRHLTRDERRLLRALSAAQADDPSVLDNYLYPIALDRTARGHLAEAIRFLAEALGAAGYRLASLPNHCVPASALRVAFAHGFTLDEIEVTWPGRLHD